MDKNRDGVATKQSKIKYRGVKAMPFIIGNEIFENLGTTGTSTNLLVYLTTVFNMKSITATTLINIFYGTTNIATLLGAFLCDTYFGRYKTLGFATITSFLGMLVITLTAAISKLHPPHCGAEQTGKGACPGPTTRQMGFLISGLGLLVIGAGGIRPCNLAFGADQFDPNTDSGKRGISSFCNWYYFTSTLAMIISLTVIVYVQSVVSWALGLGIPAFLMFLACVLFFSGSRIYVKVKPDGSLLKSMVQVIVAAVRKRRLKLPEQPWISLFNHVPTNSINSKLPYSHQFRFLDKGAIVTLEDQLNSDGSAVNPWRLCSMQKVEEVKCLIRVIPIWASSILYYIALSQQQTYVVFQALQSDRRLGNTKFKIPAASYTLFSMVSLGIWLAFYDRIIVPWLQKLTKKQGGITILQRMGIGLFLVIVTMFVSALIEDQRRTISLTKPPVGINSRGYAISSLSGLWLIPQLTLVGVSEAFTVIAQVEFFYKEFPENMRSISMSLSFVGVAGSSYLNSVLLSVVHRTTKRAGTGNWLPEDLNKGRLDYFYYLVAALGVINLVYFLVCARWYKYKGDDKNYPEVAMNEM